MVLSKLNNNHNTNNKQPKTAVWLNLCNLWDPWQTQNCMIESKLKPTEKIRMANPYGWTTENFLDPTPKITPTLPKKAQNGPKEQKIIIRKKNLQNPQKSYLSLCVNPKKLFKPHSDSKISLIVHKWLKMTPKKKKINKSEKQKNLRKKKF